MKRIVWILTALLTLAACGGKEPVTPEPQDSVSLNVSELSFTDADASTKLVSVTASGAWTASVSDTWIHVSPTSGSGSTSLSVKADANTGTASRSGSITVKAGSASASVRVSQEGSAVVEIVPKPAPFSGTKLSGTTYQLLIYSFADSDGDGVGDFKGIQNKLDYLDGLGATALWLSPAHPTNSYHAYDVNDYSALNPLYGTEADFKSLIDAAHAKGIGIYMDFVLNHSGTGHEWFKSVKADPKNSPYRDYYVLSNGPYPSEATGGMGGWVSLGDGEIGYKGRLHFKVETSSGKPSRITISETSEPVTGNVSNPSLWIYTGTDIPMAKTADNVYEVTADINTSWGVLVRTVSGSSWPDGSKYGAKDSGVVTFGKSLALAVNGKDIVFGETTSYYASFDASMPDLNYGNPDECEKSRAFQSTVESATKWINMGVDGFRLDAVVWVYNENIKANQRFLDQWYQAVNAAYKAAGHSDNIFMVGEAWKGHGEEKQYYKGLISCFEFEYFGAITRALGGSGSSFASSVSGWVSDHTAQRPDAVTSIFLTNHDQARAAESLQKNLAKEKQAAAMLLTSPGKPFIYQGEELGYWGTQGSGDEYVRAPIVWDAAAKECAKKGVNNKVDNNMLKGSISVETQSADEGSLLNVYKTWSRLRNTYAALASGEMTTTSLSGFSFASWYMTAGSQKLLVIHNVAGSEKNVTVSDDMSKPIALLGTASVKNTVLTLGPNSSVVFQLNN